MEKPHGVSYKCGMEAALESLLPALRQPFGGLVLGLCSGILTGLFGAGGGFIITPALNIFLGLPYNFAVGTSTCQILGASSFALWHHLDRRVLGLRIAALTAAGVPFGSFFGVLVVNNLRDMENIEIAGKTLAAQEFWFTVIFCVFLSLIAAWMFYDNFFLRRGQGSDEEHVGCLAWVKVSPMIKCQTIPAGPFSLPVLILLGFCTGFLGGLLGIGGGVIMMPMLFYVVGQETKYAALTSTMLVFATALISTVLHASNGNIKYLLVAFLISGAFIGTRIGVALQRKLSGKAIRKHFAFVVLLAVLMVLYKLAVLIGIAPAGSGA